MGKVAIRVEGLSKKYSIGSGRAASFRETFSNMWKRNSDIGEFWALRNVSFEVEKGEAVGIIGRNGAGKSTLLKILSQITIPTSGKAEIYGRVSSLLEVGTGFHPELTGRENVYLNGTILGMRRSEVKSKFDEIVAFSGVEKFIDTPIKHYSSGMKVRLAFAVAAHLKTEILIIDEVLAVGDYEFQKKCLGKMEEVTGEGRTVLFVSHNLAAVQSLCSKGMFFDEGQIKFSGPVDQCIEEYLHKTKSQSLNQFNDRKRSTTGSVTLTNISFLNERDEKATTLCSGMTLKIQIEFKAIEIPQNLIFRIQFISAAGHVLFVCNNNHSSASFNPSSLEGIAICTINSFPLNEGTYSINVLCLVNYKVSDELEYAYGFDIEKGDFFGTGRLPDPRQGILIPHKWELREN